MAPPNAERLSAATRTGKERVFKGGPITVYLDARRGLRVAECRELCNKLIAMRAAKILFILTAAAYSQDFTGTWQGTSQGPRGEFRLVIKISKGDGGALKAMLYSIDQSGVGNPGSITVEGSNVKMAIPGPNLTFDGKLSADRLSIAGTWMRNGTPMTCSLKHVVEDAAWDTQHLKFDAASIKPSGPGVKRIAEVRPLPGGRISATYMPVKNLIQVAFRLRP